MGLFDMFQSKQLEELLEEALHREMTNPQNKSEIYREITNCYRKILSLLHVHSFHSFQFVDYEDHRRVVVDGKAYDFDREFHHNDGTATEILCAIDGLMADLEEDVETVLRNIEEMIASDLSTK